MKKAKETKKQTAYVLVSEPIAGLKPAVYHVDFCLRVGEDAFISRSVPFKKLIVVPASWVFDTAEAARLAATRRGQVRWCVLEKKSRRGRREGELEIVKAFVREGLRESFFGSGYRYRSYVLREGAKEPEVFYGLHHFATRDEARRSALRQMRERLKKATASAREAARDVALLRAGLRRLEGR